MVRTENLCEETSIGELDLTVRNYNGRLRQNIHTVGDLLPYLRQGRDALRKMRFINETYLEEIMNGLQTIGCIPDDLPDDLYFPNMESRLLWLARIQADNGSWHQDIEQTTAAALSFIRAGHTATTGIYQTQVLKALNWLQMNQHLAENTVAYALSYVFAEHEGDPIPQPPFEIPTSPYVYSLEELRKASLVYGNAVLIDSSEYGVRYGILYEDLDLTWMAVGKPKEHSSE